MHTTHAMTAGTANPRTVVVRSGRRQLRSRSSSRSLRVAATPETPPPPRAPPSSRPPPPPRRQPQQQRNKDRPPSRIPKNGFFSDVDPNATIYPVKSSLKQDPTQRSKDKYQSDFVWNSNWKEALEYNDTLVERAKERERATSGDADGYGDGDQTRGDERQQARLGRLSLAKTKQDLNSMDVDLTAQLLSKPSSPSSSPSNIPTIQVVPKLKSKDDTTLQRKTQRESRSWSRSARYGSKPIASSNTTPDQEAEQEEDALAYDKLKAELYLWTIGLTAVCLTAAVTFYGRDVAASYGVGALAGFLYLRSLSRSVDGFGSGLGGAGSPRLLIPLILAAGYNRYNSLVAEETGVTVSLLPMLVGFFTYKVAVVGKQGIDLADDIFGRNEREDVE